VITDKGKKKKKELHCVASYQVIFVAPGTTW